MEKKNYILETLAYVGFPKIFTFFLTLISFPILIRSIGAFNYGTVLYVTSTISLFEVIIDFGVPSAAGKAIAVTRVKLPGNIKNEFYSWFKLQLIVVLIGILPFYLISYYIVNLNSKFFISNELLILIVLTVLSNAILSFLRPTLTSLLEFKSLSILDSLESIFRSVSYILVAFLSPSAFSFVLSSFFVSVVSTILAFYLVFIKISDVRFNFNNSIDKSIYKFNYRISLLDSAQFLWLKLSTRLYQELPIFFIGKLAGPELIGIIGAYKRILEIISTPYLIIGNSLSVKVHEFHEKGRSIFLNFWNVIIKILSTSFLFTIVIFVSSDWLGVLFLPDIMDIGKYFSILSLMIPATCIFGLIAPMSDYLGGLNSRNRLLTSFAFIQLPLFYVANFYGTSIVLFVYVLVNSLLAIGYTSIANKVFFNTYRIHFQKESILFIFLIIFSMVAANIIFTLFYMHFRIIEINNFYLSAFVKILLFLAIAYFLMRKRKHLYNLYFDKNFFRI